MEEYNIKQALDAFKDGKAALAQSKEQPDGTTRFFNVYGDVHDGWDHILNIFIDGGSIQQILKAALQGKLKKCDKVDSKELKGIEVTIDQTDIATTWLYRKTEEKVYLESYQRDYHKAFNDPDVDREWQLENGHLQLTKEALLEDDDLLYVVTFESLIKHLDAEGLTEELRKLNKYAGAGILVTAKDEDSVSARIVQGDERPDLPCDAFLMGTITCRPYLDEILRKSNGNELADRKQVEQIKNQQKEEKKTKARAAEENKAQESEEETQKRIQAEKERKEAEEKARIEKEQEKKKLIAERNSAAQIIQSVISVSNDAIVIVKSDGTVVSTGLPDTLRKNINAWTGMRQVCLCNRQDMNTVYAVGLKRDGTIIWCGNNANIPLDFSNWRDIIQIDIGYRNVYGLRSDGTCMAIGDNSENQLRAEEWKNIKKISGNTQSALGLYNGGTVISAGTFGGPLSKVNAGENIIDIELCSPTAYFLTDKGELWESDRWNGEERLWKDITAFSKSTGDPYYIIAVDTDGHVQAIYKDKDKHQDVSGWNSIIYVTGSGSTIVGVKEDGTLVFSTGRSNPVDLMNVRLFNNYRTIKEEWKNNAHKQIKELENELSNTKGLFAGGKRKKLQQQIDELKSWDKQL